MRFNSISKNKKMLQVLYFQNPKMSIIITVMCLEKQLQNSLCKA